jgi:hypothetical protein
MLTLPLSNKRYIALNQGPFESDLFDITREIETVSLLSVSKQLMSRSSHSKNY